MAGKQQQWTTLQEPVDYQLEQDNFPLLPRGNQHEQAGNQPPQARYSPQHGYQPPQASYPPQQARYSPQHGYQPPQASYPPQQGSGATQQGGYPTQYSIYPLQQGYSPQHAGYPPWQANNQPQETGYIPYTPQQSQQQASTIEVINQQPSATGNTDGVVFGESPVRAVCPHCQVTVVTSTDRVPGFKAWLCLPLCCALFGCLVLCCLDDFMDVVHTCPFCKNKIAIYENPI